MKPHPSVYLRSRYNVHRDDPRSSYEAAAVAEPARRNHVELVAMYLTRHPGLCASQYAFMAGLDVVETRRRLTDLKNAGKAEQRGSERPTGRLEMCWFPIEEVEVERPGKPVSLQAEAAPSTLDTGADPSATHGVASGGDAQGVLL